jgi:hypothetical protein
MVSGLTKLPLKLILLGQILFCGSRLKLKYIGVYSYNGMHTFGNVDECKKLLFSK